MAGEILTAIALVLVIEGLLPAISPSAWKQAVLELAARPARDIRLFGLVLMVAGSILLHFVH